MNRAADLCTALRVLLAPWLVWLLCTPRGDAGWMPFAVYLIAASTDYIDGALARAAGTASRRGRVFDHGADALLLFPVFGVLALQDRIPVVLPFAAVTAFSLYAIDGWRRGGGPGAIELTSSRSGAIGGVLNYVLVGAATAAVIADARAVDLAIYGAAFAVAAVNAAAALERLPVLFMPAHASPAAEREARAPRS
jgi:phosphatidylglycerophosphate synthase